MYFLLKMGIFHCYVSLPEGNNSLLGAQLPGKGGLIWNVFFTCEVSYPTIKGTWLLLRKGRLVQGLYKTMHGKCAIYF